MKVINAIPSKSDAHRAMICAALSENTCEIVCDKTSEDIEATIDCIVSMKVGNPVMECGESGSTFRFMIPVVAAKGKPVSFIPRGRLSERPLSPMYEQLVLHGVVMSEQGSVPFDVSGKLESGDFFIPGNVSSQFITGLLLALPMVSGNSRIVVEGTLESEGYVQLTLDVMKKFGIKVIRNGNVFLVPGSQEYKAPDKYIVEGDWSNGCFWLGAGALLPEGVKLNGVLSQSLQGDKEITRILAAFGAKIIQDDESVTVIKDDLWGIDIDVKAIPDMVPILALLASVANGTTVIRNAGRLRLKESDRLKTVAATLKSLGADITEREDGLVIKGKGVLEGGEVDGCKDHRIVMMAAIASLVCKKKVVITGWQAVNKSYPDFFQDMEKIGLAANVERR